MDAEANKSADLARELKVAEFELPPGTTLIEASAGTGKTYTIQYIVLDFLLKGLSLPEILVVTFTEAATKELSDRLLTFLAEVNRILGEGLELAEGDAAVKAVLGRAIGREGASTIKLRISRAMLEIDQAAIYTIHGFCQRALQENAFAADANFDAELCPDLRPLVGELVMDFLRSVQLESGSPVPQRIGKQSLVDRGAKLTRCLRLKTPASEGIAELGKALNDWVARVKAMRSESDKIVAELMSFEGKLNGRSYKAEDFERFPDTLENIFKNPRGAELGKWTFSKLSTSFKKAYAGTEINHPFFHACDERGGLQSEDEAGFLLYFDTWFLDRIRRLKEERGLITYDDMILDLDRALRRSDRLRNQLRDRYRAALVDEFQDTDTRQYEIFRTVFAADHSPDRYFAMIGDPKQSIYGFRGADIDAYLKARKAAAHRFTLPTNYRSDRSLVEATNAFFEGANLGEVPAAEAEAGASIDFEAVDAADRLEERLVFSGEVDPCRLYEREIGGRPQDTAGTGRRLSLQSVADDVHALLELSGEGKVFFEHTTSGHRRPVDSGDLSILVNTHRDAESVQSALQEYGITAVRSKAGKLLETPEAKDFLFFLMACLEPREGLIHRLLISPLFGKNGTDLQNLSEEARREIYERFILLGNEWREGAAVSLVWAELLDPLRVRERLLATPNGERILTNYLHIAEYAQELERRERLSPERLRDRLRDAMLDPKAEDALDDEYLVRLESDARAVKIMTIHSAKGLEFPIVFIPDLWHSGVAVNSLSELQTVTDPEDPDTCLGLEPDPDKVLRKGRAECLRLGYVALTRAVHFTVYYNSRSFSEPNLRSKQGRGWFDDWLFSERDGPRPTTPQTQFLEELSAAPGVTLPPREAARPVQSRRFDRKLSHAYQITSFSALSRIDAQTAPSGDPSTLSGMEDVVPEDDDLEGPLPQSSLLPEEGSDLLLESFPGGVRTGTCLHEMLERCDFTSAASWPQIARGTIARHFPDSSGPQLDQRVDEVMDLLKQLTTTKIAGLHGGEIQLAELSPAETIPELEFYFPVGKVDTARLEAVLEAWAERVGLPYLPVRYQTREIEGFLTGSIDLFFRQGGRFYVLDWKTNQPLPGQARLRKTYGRDGMHAHMVHGRYYLQALIYTLAAAAHLRLCLGERFDWDTHMGGFLYCFVRGIGSSSGFLHEAFSEAEVRMASEAVGLPAPGKEGEV